MENNTPSSLDYPEEQPTDPIRRDVDSEDDPSPSADHVPDTRALRKWFHLPRFNQRDGLDDYDGDYREFDSLGEVLTAHLRHRIQRLAENNPADRCGPAAGSGPEERPSVPPAANQCLPASANREDQREPGTEEPETDESPGILARLLTKIRTTASGGAAEVHAVFCHAPLSIASLKLLEQGFPEATLVIGDCLQDPVGPGAWLGALAMGAGRIILIGDANSPAKEDGLRLARTILADLRLAPESRLMFTEDGALQKEMDRSSAPASLVPAAWDPAENDRDLLWQAVAHLHSLASDAPDMTPLDPGAPFGAVALDASRCTLCMACVGACPTSALQNGSPGPQIRFRERDCTQCGRCRQVCPEQAVTLVPRICYNPRLTGTARMLHQDAPLLCSVCGAPFATAGIVDAVTRRLAAHWMYQDQAARQRLTMCRDCRIRSCFGSPQAPPPRRPARRKN